MAEKTIVTFKLCARIGSPTIRLKLAMPTNLGAARKFHL